MPQPVEVIDINKKPEEPTEKALTPEEEIVKMVRKDFDYAKDKLKPTMDNYPEYYKFYRGWQDQQKFTPTKKRRNTNLIFVHIETVLAIALDNNPKFLATPMENQDIKDAEKIDMALAYIWHKRNGQNKAVEWEKDSLFYGTSFVEEGFDPMLLGGKGDVGWGSIDPSYCFEDPDSTCINKEDEGDQECRFFIIAEPKTLHWIRKNHPEEGGRVKAELDVSDVIAERKEQTGGQEVKSPVDSDTIITDESSVKYLSEKATYIKYWVRDEEIEDYTEEVENKDTDGKKKATKKRKKYPTGRFIAMASDVVLDDKPNPREDGRIPIVKLGNFVLPHEFRGMSEIEQLTGQQRAYDEHKAQLRKHQRIMGKGVWIKDRTSGIEDDDLINKEGLIITKNEGSEVRRDYPDALPGQYYTYLDFLKKDFDIVSMLHDITHGRRPKGITAASAIGMLQEAGQTVIRPKIKAIEKALSQLGSLIVADMQQNYTTKRMMRLTGKKKAFEFSKEDIIGQWDIKVEAGSTMFISKWGRYQQAKELFEANAIDQEALLKASDFPDADKILERMKTAAQGPAAGPGGPIPGGPGGDIENTSTDPTAIMMAMMRRRQAEGGP